MVSKLKKLALIATCLCSSYTGQSYYLSPHIGADFKYWGAKPDTQATATGITDFTFLFPDITTSGNFYFGTRINGYWGIDLGYEQSWTKEKTQLFDGNVAIFGDPENAGDSASTDVRLKAWHLDGLVYWELVRRFEMLFMGGLAIIKPDTHIFYTTNGTRFELTQSTRSKWVGRLGIGAQYNIGPYLGIRGLVHFDQTQRIKYLGNDEDGAPFDIRPYRGATSLYLGAVYSFSKPRR